MRFVGGMELVVMVIGVAALVSWVWALVDALTRPSEDWEKTGQSQILWVIVLLLLNALGAIAYFVTRGSRRIEPHEGPSA